VYVFTGAPDGPGTVRALTLANVGAVAGAATATTKWTASVPFPAEGGWYTGTAYMAVGNGLVYADSMSGPSVSALSAATGALSFSVNLGGGNYVEGSPALSPSGGTLWTAGRNTPINVVNALTGATAVTSIYAYSIPGAPTYASGYNCALGDGACWPRSTLAFDAAGNVYMGSYDNNFGNNGGLLSMTPAGTYRWWRATGCSLSSPALSAAGDVVFAACNEAGNGKLLAMSAATGVVLWTYSWPGGGSFSLYRAPTVSAAGLVFVSLAPSGQIYAVTAATGALAWSFTTPTFACPSCGSASSSNSACGGITVDAANVVFVGCGPVLYALAGATGTALWTYTHTAGAYFTGTPVIAAAGVLLAVDTLGALNVLASFPASCAGGVAPAPCVGGSCSGTLTTTVSASVSMSTSSSQTPSPTDSTSLSLSPTRSYSLSVSGTLTTSVSASVSVSTSSSQSVTPTLCRSASVSFSPTASSSLSLSSTLSYS